MNRLRRLHQAVLARVVVLAFALALNPVSALPPDGYLPGQHCPGNTDHPDHDFPVNTCKFAENPHFAHIGNQACPGSGAHSTCIGCQACCNGKYNYEVYCLCYNNVYCEQAAQSAWNTCQGACIGDYEGDGCEENGWAAHV